MSFSLFVLISLVCITEVNSASVKISYSAIAANQAAVWMGEEFGTYKKHGLDVDLVYIASSGTSVQGLLGGSLDMIVAGASGIVLAAFRGAPIVTVGAVMNRPAMVLYVQPNIATPNDLAGQVIGITRYNSSTHAVAVLVLRKLGLETAVTLRPMGDTPAMQAAFEQKAIAGMMTTVKPRAQSRALLNAADLEIPYALSVIATTPQYLQAKRDTVERFLKGYIEGVARMNQDKEKAVKVMAKYLRINNPDILEEAYNLAKNYTEKIPRVDRSTIPPIMEFAQIKDVGAEALAAKVIDNSLADKLVQEKFVQKAFGR
jgi:NitT/TauT family transport system substrate-binding protein